MSVEAVIVAFDAPPPSTRSGVPEPKGRPMGSRAEVTGVLEQVFGPLNIGPNGTGGFHDLDGPSLLVDLGGRDPCTWIGLKWRGIDDMDDQFARLRRMQPDWYLYSPFANEWHHHLGWDP